MSQSNRIVINSASRRTATAVIIPDHTSSSVWGDSSSARALQAVLVASLFGALAHELLGVGAAMVVVVLVLPVLAAWLVAAYSRRTGSPDAILQNVVVAAVVAPVLALPSALLGLAVSATCAALLLGSRWAYQQLGAWKASPRLEVIELSL